MIFSFGAASPLAIGLGITGGLLGLGSAGTQAASLATTGKTSETLQWVSLGLGAGGALLDLSSLGMAGGALLARNKTLMQALTTTQRKVAQQALAINQKKQIIYQLESTIDSMHEEEALVDARLLEINNETDQLGASLARSRHEVSALNERLKASRLSYDQLRQGMDDLRAENMTLKENLNALAAKTRSGAGSRPSPASQIEKATQTSLESIPSPQESLSTATLTPNARHGHCSTWQCNKQVATVEWNTNGVTALAELLVPVK